MILDNVLGDVSAQLDDQFRLGIQITTRNTVPENGPTNRGLWYQIPNVSAVFVDIKASTDLNAHSQPAAAARVYTYFVRAMAVIFERFSAAYVDIQGDGLFALFSGSGSIFNAAACSITIASVIERDLGERVRKECATDWELTAGIGIDRGTLLVRRLGLRGFKLNEVWAGKPVNVAAKLSSLADPNQVAVSERVFRVFEGASATRRRVLLWSCGCNGSFRGRGQNAGYGETSYLWSRDSAPNDLGLDFSDVYRLHSHWCINHGADFCETLVTGIWP